MLIPGNKGLSQAERKIIHPHECAHMLVGHVLLGSTDSEIVEHDDGAFNRLGELAIEDDLAASSVAAWKLSGSIGERLIVPADEWRQVAMTTDFNHHHHPASNTDLTHALQLAVRFGGQYPDAWFAAAQLRARKVLMFNFVALQEMTRRMRDGDKVGPYWPPLVNIKWQPNLFYRQSNPVPA